VEEVKEVEPDYEEIRRYALSRVEAECFGMSKFAAAQMRGKTVVMQIVASHKLTPAQYLTLDVPALMLDMQRVTTTLNDADRELITPITEEEFDDLKDHDRRVRKNVVLVKSDQDFDGEYLDRVSDNAECHEEAKEVQTRLHALIPGTWSRYKRSALTSWRPEMDAVSTIFSNMLDFLLLCGVVLYLAVALPFAALPAFGFGAWQIRSARRDLLAEWQICYPRIGRVSSREYSST